MPNIYFTSAPNTARSMIAVADNLGLTAVSKTLIGELEVLEALPDVDEGRLDVSVEAHTVTAKDLPKLVEKIAAAYVQRRAVAETRIEFIEALQRRVFIAVQQTGPELIAAMADGWNELADEFTELLHGLPDRLEPAQLYAAGSDTLARFEHATRLAEQLEAGATIRNNLSNYGVGIGIGHLEAATRYCTVASIEAATAAVAVRRGPLYKWGELARLDGIELHWRSLDDQRQHAASITHTPEAAARIASGF